MKEAQALLMTAIFITSATGSAHGGDLVEMGYPNLLKLSGIGYKDPEDNTRCPPWFLPGEEQSCKCSDKLDRQIICSIKMWTIYVMVGYCMTWHESEDIPVLARCPYHYLDYTQTADGYLQIQPEIKGENLTNFVCSHFNRTGELCNSCSENHGPAPFSYGITCGECQGSYKWLYYLVFQLLVLTIMFIVCTLFMVQLTKSPFNVLVFYWQTFVVALNFDGMLYGYSVYYTSTVNVKAIITFYAIWNLDFFRYYIPPLCVTSSMSGINVLLFDYIIALYPVLLTIVLYICIDLYDRKIRLVVLVWKPFLYLFTRCRTNWNPKESIIKSFATFLLLAYTKLLFTSANLLYGTQVYDHNGKQIPTSPVLYYNSKISFFSKEHAPYIFVAFSVFLLTLLPLLLLLLYPTRIFKRSLERCGFRRWHILQIFMDTFQGWYKDGTGGTRDYRWVSGLYLIFRMGFVVQCFATVMSKNTNQLFWILPGIICITTSVFYMAAQPYKLRWMNNIDGMVLAVLGINFFIFYQYFDFLVFTMVMVVASVPLLLCIVYGMIRLIKFTNICPRVQRKWKQLFHSGGRLLETENSLPHRMLHPNSYSYKDPYYNSLVDGQSLTCEERDHPTCTYGSM